MNNNAIKTIVMGSDHAGYNLKLKIKAHLESRGLEVLDVGTDTPESCNYTIFAHAVCEAVTGGKADLGILVCGTGIGMSICANKFKGIRAAVCGDHFSAEFTRKHNDSNVLCMGARTIGAGVALQLADIFLSTEFEGGRHQKRVDMITAFEEN